MGKRCSEPAARKAVQRQTGLLSIGPLGCKERLDALLSNEADFEDGLVRSSAELNDADFIITRDTVVFASSPVKSMTLREFIAAGIEQARHRR